MINWKEAPFDAQYYCNGEWYKRDAAGYWFVYWPHCGWEAVGYNSPENFAWWASAIKRPAQPSPQWRATELLEKIRLQVLDQLSGKLLVYTDQLNMLEELIDEIYLAAKNE